MGKRFEAVRITHTQEYRLIYDPSIRQKSLRKINEILYYHHLWIAHVSFFFFHFSSTALLCKRSYMQTRRNDVHRFYAILQFHFVWLLYKRKRTAHTQKLHEITIEHGEENAFQIAFVMFCIKVDLQRATVLIFVYIYFMRSLSSSTTFLFLKGFFFLRYISEIEIEKTFKMYAPIF